MKVFVFGEAMLETRAGGEGGFAYGGDALNTAVYMARTGLEPQFVTALGMDATSDALIAAWRQEGVGTDHVLRHPSRLPGRYAIATNAQGERTFTYDRAQSAARAFFETDGWRATFDAVAEADLLYVTGITLSIFSTEHRASIRELMGSVRARGGEVAFDPNYRRQGWPSAADARSAVEALAPHISIALPSIEDHVALFGDEPPEAAANRWIGLGAREVVMKLGADGVYVAADGLTVFTPAAKPSRIVDTTAAGDAFNGAYLAARLLDHLSPEQAAARGVKLAAEVIGWPGAIAPRDVGRVR